MNYYSVKMLIEKTGKDRATISRAIAACGKKIAPIRQKGIRGLRLTEKDANYLISFCWPSLKQETVSAQ